MTVQNNILQTEHLIWNIPFAYILSCDNVVCLASEGISYADL